MDLCRLSFHGAPSASYNLLSEKSSEDTGRAGQMDVLQTLPINLAEIPTFPLLTILLSSFVIKGS